MNETEGYKALVTGLDVRGWIANDLLEEYDGFDIMGSADGKTWETVVNPDNLQMRLSEVYNGYTQFSILLEELAEEYSMIKIVFGATDGDFAVSDIQIFYTEDTTTDDEGGNDDNQGGNDDNQGGNDDDNEEDTNPDTGVVAPIAALVLATISGAAVVINKRR
jgi:hypothetical protein